MTSITIIIILLHVCACSTELQIPVHVADSINIDLTFNGKPSS